MSKRQLMFGRTTNPTIWIYTEERNGEWPTWTFSKYQGLFWEIDLSDSINFGEIAKILRLEVINGATPSQAGKKVIEKYGLISVVDMLHCFLEAFQVEDSDFTAAIFVWELYETVHALNDFEFDRRLTPMIEKTRGIWTHKSEYIHDIEFIVEETPVSKSSMQWEIVGRCSTDLSKGAQFIKAIPYSVELDKQHKSYEPRKESGFSISLTIEKILSWKREWDLINTGMTAKLLVSGDASKIHKRMLLVA